MRSIQSILITVMHRSGMGDVRMDLPFWQADVTVTQLSEANEVNEKLHSFTGETRSEVLTKAFAWAVDVEFASKEK